MKNRRTGLLLAFAFGVAVILGSIVPMTIAYITTKTDTITNTFSAPYFPPNGENTKVAVYKTVKNVGWKTIGPEGFRFALMNQETKQTTYMTTDEKGHASVLLPFSDENVGKRYTYLLSEVNDGRENVTYSEVVYTITIDVSVNADNNIVTDLTLNGEPVEKLAVEFENVYGALAVPMTGDNSRMMLFVVLLAISCAGIFALKRFGGRSKP